MSSFQSPIDKGSPTPLGATASTKGINFAFHAKKEQVSLLLFKPNTEKPFLILPLDPSYNKTKDIWHVFIKELTPPFEYSIKIEGEKQPILDPYSKSISLVGAWKEPNTLPLKSRCFISPSFNWENIQKPLRPFNEWIIYEMHVRGFTVHPSSQTPHGGTFLDIIEKIPYLLSLGVNAIELLPVFTFNENANPRKNPLTGESLCNFWGYSPINFFSLMQKYSTSSELDTPWATPITEFKTLVKELHKNGIAIILDVVYNHTAEDGEDGETQSFKALDKTAYYLCSPEGKYDNFTGTGNTVNCNNPLTSQLIVDSLCYFANELQVDAFRFDLASIFCRGEGGAILASPPILKAIKEAPLLQNTQFIAEAWDASGLYQVGSFPAEERWAEWNGEYRDVVRRFIKGLEDQSGAFAKALCGSQNLYWKDTPFKSINFITAHDGFSLYDLVSYNNKHNQGNGENNQDGMNNNDSWNCGIEGEAKDPQVLSLRTRQMKNFLVALMVSLGVPMILMGDEYGHTRKGNNNPYCQDNEVNWFLWNQAEKNKKLLRFWQKLLHFRMKKKQLFCRENFLTDKDIIWHGKEPFKPDWGAKNHLIIYTLIDHIEHKNCLIAFNSGNVPITFTVPPCPPKNNWKLTVNTAAPSPLDFPENSKDRISLSNTYLLKPHSAILAELDF